MQFLRHFLCCPMISGAALFMTACGDEAAATPEAAATDFMQKFLTGDSEGAIACIDLPADDADAAQMAAGKIGAMSQAAKKDTEKRGGIDSIEAVETKMQGNDQTMAVVKVKVTFKNDKVKVDAVKLVKDAEGSWKVSL